MSASHAPARIRWGLPVFGLAFGLAALVGLIVILNASAAPPSPLENPRPAALNSAPLYPPSQPPARISSANAPVAPTRTAPSYQPSSGRSTFVQRSPAARQARSESQQELRPSQIAGEPDGLVLGSAFAPAAIAAGKVITFGLDGTVLGYTDANSPVHLVLTRGGMAVGEARASSDGLGYFRAELMRAGRWAQVQPGDVLQVNATTDAKTLTAPNITGTVNPGTNTVAGQITGVPRPAQLRLEAWGNVLPVTTDAAGNFTANFAPLIDLTWFTGVAVSYRDADGDWLTAWLYPQDGMVINSQWESVYGYTDPGTTVAVTVKHGATEMVGTVASDVRSGWWSLNFDTIAPGDSVIAEVGGATIVATIPAVTAVADGDLDRLSGAAPPGMSLSLGQGLQHEFTWRMDLRSAVADAGGAYARTFPAGQVDALSNLYVFPHVTAKADLYLYASPRSAVAHWAWNQVYGDADLGSTVTAQLTDGAVPPIVLETVQATADGSGYFWASFNTPFQVGQRVLVQGGGLNENILLDELTVRVDVATDLVSGRAPANADLTISGGNAGNGSPSYWGDTSAGAGGDYQLPLAGILDLRNNGRATTLHPQGNDEDQAAWLGVWCSAPYLEVNETHDWVWGSVDKPNVPVTLTLKTGAGTVKGVIQAGSNTDCSFYSQQFTDGGGSTIDIAPGDKITFERPGWSQTVTVTTIAATVNAATERVTGTGPANAWVEIGVRTGSPTLRVPTEASGAFLADFTGLADIRAGDEAEVGVYDGNWNRSYAVGTAPYARANVDWDAVDGWFGPGVTVQYTVTDGEGNPKGGATGVAKPDGWLDGTGCGCDMQPGDHVTVHTSAGFDTELNPIPITGAIDVAADRVSGQMARGDFPGRAGIWLWSPARNEGRWREVDVDAAGNYVADFASDFDIRDGDRAEVWYFDANRNQVGVMLYTPYLQVRANRAHDWVQGDATPQTTVFVTVTRGGQVVGTGQNFTGGGTWWQVNPQRPEGGNVDMRTGDIVDVTAGELSASLLLIDMDGAVDAATDVVSGKLVGVPFPADVRVEVWRNNGDSRDLRTDDHGNFSIDFGAFDIRQGDQVGIWYVRPDGHMVGIVRSDFRLEAELRDNDLWGMTTPNTRVDLTLLAGGTVKGTATAWSDREGNFGNRFTTAAGQTADIAAGDVINGAAGGKATTMSIPQPLSASYDHVANTVCGQAPAGTQVQVDLWGYGTQYPTADGSKNYCATFGGNPGIDTEGQAAVDLPVGHRAFVRIRTLTPALWLNKWSDGQPPAGGYHRYTLRLGNDGWADVAASGAVLTDTLPAGMTFVSESTGAATVTGNRVVWRPGTIARGTERDITLTVRVNASVTPGAELENCAEVAVPGWESDRGNNTACDRRQVVENQADLSVSGNAAPGDPAAGSEYIYRIYYNNNRSAGSRNVRITDTLPAGTTFVSEWNPGGWTVDTTHPGLVVWKTDYLPGWAGRRLELRLRTNGGLAQGTNLHNRVEIAGEAPDVDPNNNTWENDANVQEPYGSVSIGQWYSHGIPVAGYEYTTQVQVWSNGNVPAAGAVLTDTLPTGASFVRSVQRQWNPDTDNWDIETPFEPLAQGAGWVRWRLPNIPNWRQFQMDVTFRIGAGTAAGTVLINTVDVALAGDGDPANNHAEYSFRTQAPGPNLRVSKWYDWGDVAPGNTVQYQLRFENDGTEPIYDPVFKDILPDHTTLNGFGWGEQPTIEGKTLTWTPNWQLNPGDQHGFWLQVHVDDGTPAGTILTNTAEGSSSTHEVLDTDNQEQVALAVGPDLRVEKELISDSVRPGYRVRYRIRARNDGWAWANNVTVTDTLPAGTTFAWSNRGCDVVGNQVIWHLGNQNPGWREEFELEVEVARNLAAGSTVTNRLEITNDQGDAHPGDNAFELASTVNSPYLFRVQESHNWVNGEALPNAPVHIVLRDRLGAVKHTTDLMTGGDGNFFAGGFPDIVPGDTVEMNTEGSAVSIPVVQIDGSVNPATDRIAGKVYGVSYPATVRGEVWVQNGTSVDGQTDGAGNYNLSFAPYDVRNGHAVALWYVRPDGHQVGIVRQALFVRVYPADDKLWGSTAPNTAVNVTLRNAAGVLKGTAAVISGPDGTWSTDIRNGAARVEIDDHDKVQVTAGGLTANLVVPRITVLPDAAHDRLDVYSELPDTGLEFRWDSSPGQDNHDLAHSANVTTDGAGHASLDFGPTGGLALGVNGNLYYYDADGHCIEPWWRAMIELVDPTEMLNTARQEVEIVGVGFEATPTVYLGQDGAQQIQLTNVRLVGTSGTVLKATVPAGTPAGIYELHVYNPDERIGFLADGFRVKSLWRIRLPLILKSNP